MIKKCNYEVPQLELLIMAQDVVRTSGDNDVEIPENWIWIGAED